MQKEERNLDVECAEDDAIRTVPSGQSIIIIDPSQSLQVLSVPGMEHVINVTASYTFALGVLTCLTMSSIW